MLYTFLLAMTMVAGEDVTAAPPKISETLVNVPELADQAERSYLVQR